MVLTLPVDSLSELIRLRVIDDVGNDVFGLAKIVFRDGRESRKAK
jgi:hypothetical protein